MYGTNKTRVSTLRYNCEPNNGKLVLNTWFSLSILETTMDPSTYLFSLQYFRILETCSVDDGFRTSLDWPRYFCSQSVLNTSKSSSSWERLEGARIDRKYAISPSDSCFKQRYVRTKSVYPRNLT